MWMPAQGTHIGCKMFVGDVVTGTSVRTALSWAFLSVLSTFVLDYKK